MMISPEQGKFLSFLVRAIGARRCLEIGTFTGYSSVCIAAGMKEGTESILYCLECNESYARTAQREWTNAGLQDRISLVLEDATEISQKLIVEKEGWFDFIFIDAEKEKYREYYETALALLRVGGVLCIDDTCWSGRVVDEQYQDPETLSIRELLGFMQKDSRVFACPIPIFDGMVVAVKLFTTRHSDNFQVLLSRKIIDIEGNIAVGKTCLVRSLFPTLETQGMTPCVFEEDPNHTFLSAFYQKPEIFGFSFQMYMLKLAQQVVIKAQHYLLEDTNNVGLIDRSIWGNRVFADCNHHLGNFSQEEYGIYKSVYNETEFQPDYLIYLDASPSVCLERAKKRGRSAEQELQLSYLEALDTFHFQHLISTICEGRAKVLVFNCHMFCTAEQVLDKIREREETRCCKLIWNNQSNEKTKFLWFLHLSEDCYHKMAKGATSEEWFGLLRSWNLSQNTEITDICLPWISSEDQVPFYQYQAFKRLVCFALSANITIQFYKDGT
ncbi:O-methyltransferase, partial [Galdieria sulphuraria]